MGPVELKFLFFLKRFVVFCVFVFSSNFFCTTKVHLCIYTTMMMTQNFLCPARCNGHYRGDERGIIRLIRGTARGESVDDDDFVFG